MKIKWFLILAPTLLSLVLLQSYFWVPTYETQTKGNPERAFKFIEASIGDAKILNPILNADGASSRIAGLVFEGLLDYDENLKLRGRLATDWKITEFAYLELKSGISPEIITKIRQALTDNPLVTDISLIPATVEKPERLKFSLKRVEQDFFEQLKPIINTEDMVIEHNPVILFHLRHGVYFHDGHEFDAGDVKFTYESIMNPKNLSPRTSDFEPIKAVEIVDKYTVRVVYKRLFSPAINAWTIGILPEHLLNKTKMLQEMEARHLSKEARAAFGMRDSQFNRHPIGVGPFRFVEWRGDEFIHLIRNDNYWEGPPQYKDYYYRVIPDAVTQEVEFRTGAIDTYSPQPHQAARYKKDSKYQSFSSLGFGYTYIGYNNRKPLFANKRIRKALGMAINVDEIIKYILYGEAERITGPYPKNTRWYDKTIQAVPYDPQAALRIFAELGWHKNADGWLEKDGKIFEFNLITNNGNMQRKAIMTIAQNNWRKLGIKCNTQVFEWAVFLKDFINTGKFDAVILGWSMGIDPDLYQLWHSSQSGENQLNFVGYNNPEADALIVEIRQEYDQAIQEQLTHKLHRIIADDQPYTFLYAPLSNLILDKKIMMVNQDGSYSKLKPTKTGDVFFYFNRWRKVDIVMSQ